MEGVEGEGGAVSVVSPRERKSITWRGKICQIKVWVSQGMKGVTIICTLMPYGAGSPKTAGHQYKSGPVDTSNSNKCESVEGLIKCPYLAKHVQLRLRELGHGHLELSPHRHVGLGQKDGSAAMWEGKDVIYGGTHPISKCNSDME